MTGLKITTGSPRVLLPDDAITRSFGILGMRGSGKSNAAVVLAEEMFAAGDQWVAIDPKGDWWGMKSSGDGKGPGLPIVIFGGEHQDVALEPTAAAGVEVAEALLGERITAIIDLSEFTKGQKIEFLAGLGGREGFAERLVRRKKRDQDPLHVFLEEAHDYVPQRATGEVGKMVEVVGRIQTMGRQKGMGCSVLSQRSARVHKDVLSQIDTLFAMRTVGPHDRKAILEWVQGHGLAKELVDSLPELEDGEAEALQSRMAEAIERAKEQDPGELQKRIRQLQAELRKRPTETKVEERVEEVRVEVPVFTDGEVGRLEKAVSGISDVGEQLVAAATEIGSALQQVHSGEPGRAKHAQRTPARSIPRRGSVPAQASGRARSSHSSTSSEGPKPEPAPDGDFQPSRSQQRILDALAWLEGIGLDQAARPALAFLAHTRPTSGGFKNNLGAMRTAGLLEYPTSGTVQLTDAGRAAARAPTAPLTPEELQEQVYARVTTSQAAILRELVAAYPDALWREDLAKAVEVPVSSGGFKNNLGALRSLGLVDYPNPGYVAALPVLFLEVGG